MLLLHSEILRRQELERRARTEATEQVTAGALMALPTIPWQGGGEDPDDADVAKARSRRSMALPPIDECCLCMEVFRRDEEVGRSIDTPHPAAPPGLLIMELTPSLPSTRGGGKTGCPDASRTLFLLPAVLTRSVAV